MLTSEFSIKEPQVSMDNHELKTYVFIPGLLKIHGINALEYEY